MPAKKYLSYGMASPKSKLRNHLVEASSLALFQELSNIFLEGLRKATKYLSQDSLCPESICCTRI
jgi:hypothetical protein